MFKLLFFISILINISYGCLFKIDAYGKGNKNRFTCGATLDRINTIWDYNNNSDVEIKDGNLYIYSNDSSSIGNYKCNNKHYCIIFHITFYNKEDNYINTPKGSNITLKCIEDDYSDLISKPIWYFNDNMLEDNEKYSININSLTIYDINKTDEGIYGCHIENFHRERLRKHLNVTMRTNEDNFKDKIRSVILYNDNKVVLDEYFNIDINKTILILESILNEEVNLKNVKLENLLNTISYIFHKYNKDNLVFIFLDHIINTIKKNLNNDNDYNLKEFIFSEFNFNDKIIRFEPLKNILIKKNKDKNIIKPNINETKKYFIISFIEFILLILLSLFIIIYITYKNFCKRSNFKKIPNIQDIPEIQDDEERILYKINQENIVFNKRYMSEENLINNKL